MKKIIKNNDPDDCNCGKPLKIGDKRRKAAIKKIIKRK
jgi:hypothetical protein